MDWKIPATIIILVAVVSLGVLPFFSPNFSDSLTGFFSPVKNFFSNILHREAEFGGEVVFSLSTEELNELKIGTPTEVHLKLGGNYGLSVDNKNMIIKQDVILKEFTGTINFGNFSISGNTFRISAENFEIEGNSKIETKDRNFEEIVISNLKIAELTIISGEIKTEEPRKIEAEIDDTGKIYGFSGTLRYTNNTAVFEGECTRIEMEGFSLGE